MVAGGWGMGSVTHGAGPALAQAALALLHTLQLLLVPVAAPGHHLQPLQQHLLLLIQLHHLLQLPHEDAHVPMSTLSVWVCTHLPIGAPVCEPSHASWGAWPPQGTW